jgi:hypothetical protein
MQVDNPSVGMAGAPTQEKRVIRSRARAADLHKTCYRYGLGVQKPREERVTVGMHNKIVLDTKYIPHREKCVTYTNFIERGTRIFADHFGQHGFINARIGCDFSSAVRVSICIWAHIG